MPKGYPNKPDPEEIGQEHQEVPSEKSVSRETLSVLDEMRKLREDMVEQQREIIRLKAISDENKGRDYDSQTRDKSFKGHLRFVEDVGDPIVFWKTVKNISAIDPVSGNLIQDQKMEVKTLKGKVFPSVDIHTWNGWKANQTKVKFLRMDHQTNMCDVQLSTDNGQSYVGEIIKDIPMTYLNP
jgi:hypothetical protein